MVEFAQNPEHQAEAAAPLVSILIVSYNCAPALRKCIQALEISPDRVEFEILVVDHGSRDGSQIIDTEFPEVQMLRLPHFCGQTRARNIGLRTARGEFILLLSPGVILDAGAVTALVKRLEAEPGALAVCPELVDEEGKAATRMLAVPDAAAVADAWEDPSRLGPGTDLHDGRAILLRKRTIQGSLDDRYGEYWGDVDLAYQIRKAGKKILVTSGVRGLWNRQDALWKPGPDQQTPFAADAASGAAHYIGKYFGFGAALAFRVKVVLGALVRMRLGLVSRIVSGYKIDGSSQEL